MKLKKIFEPRKLV